MTVKTYWIKTYTGLLDNPKFMQLPDNTKWHYMALYLMAKNADSGGWLITEGNILTMEDLSYHLHVDLDSLQNSIDLLQNIKFMHYENNDILAITDFEEQQGNDTNSDYAERQREQTKKRVAKHRAKLANVQSEEKEEEKEKEKEKSKRCNVTVTLHDENPSFSSDSSTPTDEKKPFYSKGELHVIADLGKTFTFKIPEDDKWKDILRFIIRQHNHNKKYLSQLVGWFLDENFDIKFLTLKKLQEIYEDIPATEPFIKPKVKVQEKDETYMPMPDFVRKSRLHKDVSE